MIWLVVDLPLWKMMEFVNGVGMTSHIWNGKWNSCSKPPTSHRKSPLFIAKPSIPSSVIKHGWKIIALFCGEILSSKPCFMTLKMSLKLLRITGASCNSWNPWRIIERIASRGCGPWLWQPTHHTLRGQSVPHDPASPTLMIFREQIQCRLHGIFRRIFTIWFHP